MKFIPLFGKEEGPVVMVDDEDYDVLVARRWRYHNRGYAATGSVKNGTFALMHRLLLGASPDKPSVDHANGDGLDNRRENLRFASALQQMRNRRPNRQMNGMERPTPFKGVHFAPKNEATVRPWRARIRVNGKSLHLGRYETDREAAKAYNVAALKYFGEFAQLNAA